MKVKIKETGKAEELIIINPETGTEWSDDLIGGTLATSDGQFVWDDEEQIYVSDQENYDWWETYLEEYENAENRKYNMELTEAEEIYINNNIHVEFNDIPSVTEQLLDDIEENRQSKKNVI
ncbi:MAG: hypothetical protein GY853_14055 [PVC group bacterium]|nr:hypothetical protein [PVC group bacterium]